MIREFKKNFVWSGFALAVLVLAGAGVIAYFSSVESLRDDGRMMHAYKVIGGLEDIAESVKNIQDISRGFVITGTPSLIKSYERARNLIATQLKSVGLLMSQDSASLRKVASLDSLVNLRVAFANRVIETRKNQGYMASRRLILSGQGMGETDSIHSILSKTLAKEFTLLDRRDAGLRSIARGTALLFSTLLIIALSLLTFVFYKLNREIANRKRAEGELRTSQELLDSIVENLPTMVLMKDAEDLRHVRINKAGEEIIGFKRKEFVGRNDHELFPKQQADFFAAKDREVLSGNEVIDIPEEPIRAKDGELRYLHTRKVALRDAVGKPKYILGICVDITAERRLNSQLNKFFSLSADNLCIAGFDGYFRRLSPAWERTLGFRIDELMRGPLVEFAHADDREATIEATQALIKGTEVSQFENRYRRKDGSYRWLQWNWSASVDDRLIYAVARDVTAERLRESEMKRLNEDLKTRTIELEAANKELESFSYSVSHDLRAPLRHIDGFLDLLRKSAGSSLDEKSLRYVNIVSSSAKEMGTLIDELLRFSRIGRSEVRKSRVPVEHLVREVIDILGPDTQGRVIHWQVEDLPEVEADPYMLKQVLANLLSNAVKYTRQKPQAEIHVGHVRKDTDDIFFVQDNGVGFDMQCADKLFGVFQRLHRAEEFEGVGIGLANVRRIISRHGGRSWAEGKVNEGATFYFSLPLFRK